MESKAKNYTIKYAFTQFLFWASTTGATCFAATYLIGCGMPTGRVGLVLASTVLLSCLFQPIFAEFADKSKKNLLNTLLVVFSCLYILCFSIQLIPGMPLRIIGIIYMVGIWSSDIMTPLINALYVTYSEIGDKINYGFSRALGALGSALSSLLLGIIISRFGTNFMFVYLVSVRILCVLLFISYPKIDKRNTAGNEEKPCTIVQFFMRYPWYCAFVVGIMFLGMFLAMTENYMIAIVGKFGGDSSNVGKILFVSSISGGAVILLNSVIRKRIKDTTMLKIAAVAYLVRSLLILCATSIRWLYFTQLFQTLTYAFLAPSQVHYGEVKVRKEDMVKGQAFSTAGYSLGCALGDLIGGELLYVSVDAMLMSGVIMTLLATIIILIAVDKRDSYLYDKKEN